MSWILFCFVGCLVVYTANSKACFREQLAMDRWWDRPCVCNDGRLYPEQEIEEALGYTSRANHEFLYTVSSYYKEPNYFKDSYTVKGDYAFKSLCKTQSTRIQIFTVKKDNTVCYVVRPNLQNIFFSECNGPCRMGYGSVPGYHCIPRGFTERSFLVYCPKKNFPCGPQSPISPLIKPKGTPPSFSPAIFSPPDMPKGPSYKARGYFCKVKVVLPTYCGCRGYFCNY